MIEQLIARASVKGVAVVAILAFVVLRLTKWIDAEIRIRNLGGHARKARTWLPYDLDFVARAVYGAVHNKNLETWIRWFTLSDGGKGYTLEVSPVGRRCIFTADPENIKAILATQFTDYGKGKPFHEEWQDFLGDSIFTTDLDQWHASRQLIRPQFIKDRVSDLDVFEEHVQILLQQVERAGGPLDISDLLFRYTLDAATHFLLGRSVGSLELPEQDFAAAFGEVQRVQSIISRAGPLNPLVPRKTFYAGIKIINEFVNPYIEDTLRLSPEELATKTKSEEGYTFLHALAGYTRDRKMLRDQLVAVLLAGRDTTASTMSWTFYELAKQPQIVAKLRQEIIDHVGLDNPPTYENLKNMKYLQNVMNETLRMYPAVPFNVRLALKDTTLPRGGGKNGEDPIGILKDTPIGYSTLVMQRRADLTPDPDHFSPERWETWQPKHWQYIPFNGGPRICIGQQFALTEMGYTLVRVFQRFEKLEDYMFEIDGGKPGLKCDIVLQPADGVRVGFVPARQKA